MPTCKCGKQVADRRGARGHVQFKDGGPHGPKGEVPDGWESLFTDLDGDDAEETEETTGDAGEERDDREPTPDTGGRDDDDSGSQSGGLKRLLTTPIDELLK